MLAAVAKRKRKDSSDGESDRPTHSRSSTCTGTADKRQRLASTFASPTADAAHTGREAGACGRATSIQPLPVKDNAHWLEHGASQVHGRRFLARGLSQINAASTAPHPAASIEIVSSNYDDWMKMAADNKINPANSWDFALIDYFADMSLLRDGAGGKINFQRASCTLDSCVKIWTSRVDSVCTATSQLLSNLINDREDERTAPGDGVTDAEGAGGSSARSRRAHHSGATLAKSRAFLHAKSLIRDTAFTIDPLFRKTRADLDEGGPGGLLLNHLSVNGQLRVTLDSADYDEGGDSDVEEDVDLVDISDLRRDFFPDLDILDELAICRSLADLPVDRPGIPEPSRSHGSPGEIMLALDDQDEHLFGVDKAAVMPPQDFFPDDRRGCASAAVDDGCNVENAGDTGLVGSNEQELMLAYFDSGLHKQWAGPEHWKVRRKRLSDPGSAKIPTHLAKQQRPKAFGVDFYAPAQKWAEELFAPAARVASIMLPSSLRPRRSGGDTESAKSTARDRHLLPDDMHFSSNKLITLFMKPTFSLKARGGLAKFSGIDDGSAHLFWGRDVAEETTDAGAADASREAGHDGLTRFMHPVDDYDVGDAARDGECEPGDALERGIDSEVAHVTPSGGECYKPSGRVDVRKLKENIWDNLNLTNKRARDPDAMQVDDGLPADYEPRTFSSAVEGLKSAYVFDELKSITPSLCFISLLHLANEKGLTLTRAHYDDEGDSMEVDPVDAVGDVYTLRVWREGAARPVPQHLRAGDRFP